MKTSLILLSALLLSGLISCSEIEPLTTSESVSSARLSKIDLMMMQHAWSVGFFWNQGIDQTGQLLGYQFEFRSDGFVKAGNGENTFMGIWYTSNDELGASITIKFDENEELGDLTHIWQISQISYDSVVRLFVLNGSKRNSFFLNFNAM